MSRFEEIAGLGPRIGEILRQARIKAGRSQADVAEAAGVNRITVTDLEGGKVENPKSQTVFVLCRELNVRLGSIVDQFERSLV